MNIALLVCVGASVAEAAAGTYTNPTLHADTPDPGVAFFNGSWYAVTTSGNAADSFPIWASSNLTAWQHVGYVFPASGAGRPAWAVSDFWAPELHFVNGIWTVYFTARHLGGYLSVGVAKSTSASILGPYTDIGAPLVADPAMGHIDPTFFRDADGSQYVLFKSDGNAIGKPTPIWIAPVNDDGTAFTGAAVQAITNDQQWEGAVTEGPWLVRDSNGYWLFYSGNAYNTNAYAVGIARASSVMGPYTKDASNPVLHTRSGSQRFYGPGHCSVVNTTSGHLAMVYHAWNTDTSGRNMLLDALVYSNGAWQVAGNVPSETAQPLP